MQATVNAIPVIGPRVDRTLDQIGEVIRHSLVPGHVFEELGVTYVGPIDGHDVRRLESEIERIAELDGVVLLHVLTQKGKGHPDALEHPERVHGVKGSPPDEVVGTRGAGREDGKRPPNAAEVKQGPAFTKAFASSLVKLAASCASLAP